MQSLEDLLHAAGSPVELVRNSQIGPYVYPVVPAEFSNWRDEQRAWRETCVLFDQSHHMTDMYVEGPDALKLLSDARRQQLRRTSPSNKAKQFVACNYDGYVIGDAILFHLDREPVQSRRPPVRCTTGCSTTPRPAATTWSSSATSARSRTRTGRSRKLYRYQVQGPNALKVHREGDAAGPLPDVKFFNMDDVHDRRSQRARAAPRHGGRSRAWSCWGRGRTATRSRRRSSRPARSSASRQVGARAYSTQHARVRLDSVARCRRSTPASKMKAYRRVAAGERLRGHGLARRQLRLRQHRGLLPDAVRARLRPFVKFDHDFIGREALEKIARAAASQEGHAGLERRRRRSLDRQPVRAGDTVKYMDMGDNRSESTDSRTYGAIPLDEIVGRVVLTF